MRGANKRIVYDKNAAEGVAYSFLHKFPVQKFFISCSHSSIIACYAGVWKVFD